MEHTYTNEDFSNFVYHVNNWMCLFQLQEWRHEFRHEQLDEGVSSRVNYTNTNKTCLFRLTKTVIYDYGLKTIEQIAFEEVCHLLFAEYTWIASMTNDEYSDINNMFEHAIINRFTRAFSIGVE